MKKYIIALFLGFSIFVSAQNSLQGLVTDNNGQQMGGVVVKILELEKETTTNVDGIYNLDNLPSGNFKVLFSFFGYQEKILEVSLNGSNNKLDVMLEVISTHIDEVIISTAFNKIQSQNVMKVEHKSIKELQKSGSATLMEGLSKIPGIAQVSTGTSIGKPVIRGLSGNRVLVYTQGVRLENQQFGEEHGLGLNDAGIESVEVIKGPASLLYGSDALGGVIYFNPENFAKAHKTDSDISHKVFSNTLGSNTSIGLRTSSEHFKFLARGSYNSHMDYIVPNGNKVTNSRYIERDFKTGFSYNKSFFSSVLRYNYNKLDLGLPEEITIQTSSRNPDYPKQGIDNHIASLHNKFFFKNSRIEANLGYIFNDRKEFEENPQPVLQMDLKTFNYDVKYYLPKIKKIETIVGIQGMQQSNKNSGEELLIPDANTNDIGVLLTANYEWKSNAIQMGIRFDNRKIETKTNGVEGEEGYFEAINRNFNSFNAALGYKTKIEDKLGIRLNLASGFRAPNLAELSSNGVHEGSNRYEIGNKNLKSEQNIQTDLNIEYGNTHFEFFVNGFYNYINNYIFISPNGSSVEDNDAYDYIQSDARLYGSEIGIHFHPHPIDWLHFTSSFENVIAKKRNGDYLPLIPANKFNNNFRTEFTVNKWLHKGYASINIESYLEQNKVSEFETSTWGYTLLNLGMGGSVSINKVNFDLSINANNLFDTNYISHLSRLKANGISNIGRNVVVGIVFKV
jgi:iron complex outermembrane recepter protein